MLLSESDGRSILAAMLTIPDAIVRVLAAGVRFNSYSTAQTQYLHESIVDCYIDLQRPVDAVSLGSYLMDRNALQTVGGPEFLASVLNHSPTAVEFARILSRDSF